MGFGGKTASKPSLVLAGASIAIRFRSFLAPSPIKSVSIYEPTAYSADTCFAASLRQGMKAPRPSAANMPDVRPSSWKP
jgi:hypothetical protein